LVCPAPVARFVAAAAIGRHAVLAVALIGAKPAPALAANVVRLPKLGRPIGGGKGAA